MDTQLTNQRKLDIAYYILMSYVVTQMGKLTESKKLVGKLAGNKQIKAELPELTVEKLALFIANLIKNAALWAMGSDKGSFSNLDTPIAYAILKYMVASQGKKIYDLVRDQGRVRQELKNELGVEISKAELLEFAAALYGDTVRFVFQG